MADNALTRGLYQAKIGPTPRNALLGGIADALRYVDEGANVPDPTNPQQKGRKVLSFLSNALGIGDLAAVADRASYGLPQTQGTGFARQMLPETRNALAGAFPAAIAKPQTAARMAMSALTNGLDGGALNRASMMAMPKPTKPAGLLPDAVPEIQFPHDNARKAWELGQRHRAILKGETAGDDFFERLPREELSFVASLQERMPVSNAFYESAVRGAKPPASSSGWRYGDIPPGGRSRNHLDHRDELGVSMARVDGIDYQWAPMAQQFKPVSFEGLLLDPAHFRGSDGEPLMVGLKKAAKARR